VEKPKPCQGNDTESSDLFFWHGLNHYPIRSHASPIRAGLMIVLDEQLLGRALEIEIARWYQGMVCFITDLRPDTVIKDDAIPLLLQERNQPTFITINEKDFWRKAAITRHFCVICFTLPDARAVEISSLLRSLLHQPLFATKKQRMGTILRVTNHDVSYYTVMDRRIKTIQW
jgi:hypothetical protein